MPVPSTVGFYDQPTIKGERDEEKSLALDSESSLEVSVTPRYLPAQPGLMLDKKEHVPEAAPVPGPPGQVLKNAAMIGEDTMMISAHPKVRDLPAQINQQVCYSVLHI